MAASPSEPVSPERKPAASTKEDQGQTTLTVPSYDNSLNSYFYKTGKRLLDEGKFEDALREIESGISSFRQVLSKEGLSEEDVALHESMAPFHYLYGTTLLYSIEESSDLQAMPAEHSLEEGDADDEEIVWENLEAARTILERIITTAPSEKLRLDLAQIYLREGDLHRCNGRYTEALRDYESCLQYREDSGFGFHHRKIADVHYNLGLMHQLIVAETAGSAVEDPNEELGKKLSEHRAKSFHHLFLCGKSLSGILGELCGLESTIFVEESMSPQENSKTTGDDDTRTSLYHENLTGLELQRLRRSVSKLQPKEEHAKEFRDTSEVLDEIQEMMDEFDSSEKGVREVTDLKTDISAMVADAIVADESSSDIKGFGTAQAAQSTAKAITLTTVKRKKVKVEEASEPSKRNRTE